MELVGGGLVPQLPPVGAAAAQAHTEEAPAMTAVSDAAGQAVATQGTRIWDRLDWAAGWHWQPKSITSQPTLGAAEEKQA